MALNIGLSCKSSTNGHFLTYTQYYVTYETYNFGYL